MTFEAFALLTLVKSSTNQRTLQQINQSISQLGINHLGQSDLRFTNLRDKYPTKTAAILHLLLLLLFHCLHCTVI